MTEQIKYSAAILAGGKSSRFGSQKALSPFRGKPLIQWVIDALLPHSDELIIIGSDPRLKAFGYPLFEDRYPNRGPLAGIREALCHSRNDHCLIMACDMPFLDGRLMKLLKSYPFFDAVVPVHDGYMEPLAAIYTKQVIPIIESQISAGRFKLRDAIEKMNYHYLQVEDTEDISDQIFVNLNTPEEWKKWQ